MAAVKPDHRLRVLCLCLAAAVLLLYGRVAGYRFLTFDDGAYVYLDDHVKSGLSPENVAWAFRDTSGGNWHPLTWISHMLDVTWFGMNAAGHHVENVLWHALNSVLLLIALLKLTGRFWRSACVAALFALHPLRLESVAWIAERKDLLGGFFYLSTVLAYGRYVARPSGRRYAVVAGLLALGLMSKPSVVTAPFLLLLLDFWPLARKERVAVLVREKLPLIALSAAVSAVTYISQKGVGAMTALESVSFQERFANAVVSYARYLGKIFWPAHLAVIYPFPGNLPAITVVACGALLLAITAAVLIFRRRLPYLPVGWFWFLGTMVPMIGLVQVGWQAYADRYTYIPAIGIAVAVVWLLGDVFEARSWNSAGWLAAAAASSLALATWFQLPYWHDDKTLFRHALASTSDNPAAEYHLAGDLIDDGSFAEAVPHLQEMIRLRPNFYAAYYMLGKSQAAMGETEPALASFSQALRLKPDYGEAYYSRATMLVKSGNALATENDFQAALRYGLSNEFAARAHDALGVIRAQRGDTSGAVAEFEKAVALKPELPEPHRNLANALLGMGRMSEALSRLEQALASTHGDAIIQTMLDGLRKTQK